MFNFLLSEASIRYFFVFRKINEKCLIFYLPNNLYPLDRTMVTANTMSAL